MAWKPGLTKVFVVTHSHNDVVTILGVWTSEREASRNHNRFYDEIPAGDITIHASILEY